MPPKASVFGHGVNINAAPFKISNGLHSELASLFPNLASVIERSAIIDGRAVYRPLAARHERTRRRRGAAVEESDRFSK
jgi:hypothetical protein